MDAQSRELLDLLQRVQGHTKKEALRLMRGYSQEGQRSMLVMLRAAMLERNGQVSMPFASVAPPVASQSPKKVPYTLLLPPEMLEAVKAAADRDGSSASQFIRTAIAKQLGRVK